MGQKKENIFKKNNFIIYTEEKVIVKNNQEQLEFYYSDISNVRISKYRNLYPNIVTLSLLLVIISISILYPKNNGKVIDFTILFLVSVLFISTFFLKYYNHKLLINNGKYGFSQIILQKKNLQTANKFLNHFNSKQIFNIYEEKSKNSKLKQCL